MEEQEWDGGVWDIPEEVWHIWSMGTGIHKTPTMPRLEMLNNYLKALANREWEGWAIGEATRVSLEWVTKDEIRKEEARNGVN